MFKENSALMDDQNKNILKKFELDYVYDNPNWDEKAFLGSYFELKKTLEKSENRDLMLSSFYADAFFKKPKQDYSDYEDKFSLPPIQVPLVYGEQLNDVENSTKLMATNVSSLTEKNNHALLVYEPLKLIQYGPSRLYNLAPSCFTFIPYESFGTDDILGSDAFTACSAIIIKAEKGIFFSHITTGCLGVETVLKYLQENWQDKAPIHLIRPEWSEEGKLVESYEKWWKLLETNFPKVLVSKYAYIAHGSDRPNNISDSSILVTRNKIMIVGRKRYPTEDYDRYSEIKSAFDNTTTKYISIDDENK